MAAHEAISTGFEPEPPDGPSPGRTALKSGTTLNLGGSSASLGDSPRITNDGVDLVQETFLALSAHTPACPPLRRPSGDAASPSNVSGRRPAPLVLTFVLTC
jgi:hypothetical protein